MKNKLSKLNLQRGQTLIETLVAIFILVMGVTAAVGLAVYSFGASASITKQIIATGLAREGVEAVKNMRDTNWLKDSLDGTCFDYTNNSNDAKCYKNWLDMSSGGGYKITGGPVGSPTSYSLRVDPSSVGSGYWVFKQNTNDFGLNRFDLPQTFDFRNSGFYSFPDFYVSGGPTFTSGNSDYYRQILLTQNSSNQFSHSEYNELVVESRVWWVDKNCPRTPTWPGLGKCSVSIQTNLTNWRDY